MRELTWPNLQMYMVGFGVGLVYSVMFLVGWWIGGV